MSFVVLQSSTNALTGVTSCCEAVMVTQPVLPTANEINAFRADIPVETDAPGEQSSPGIEVTDFLALAVLNPRTPIPVISQTASGLPAGQLPQDTIQSPAPLQGTSAPTTQTAGYQLDLQADWVPGTPTPPVPRVRFASGRVFVSHGYLHVPLRCRYDTCKGTVVVRAAGRSRVTYATGSFRIGQNLYRSIAVPLTADGRTAALDSALRSVSIVVTYQTPSAP
jgi:hypothetical protein